MIRNRMKAIIISIVLMLLIIAISVILFYRATGKGIWLGEYKYKFNADKKTVELVDFRGKEKEITVPKNYFMGFKVKDIYHTYDNSNSLEVMYIPASTEYYIKIDSSESLKKVVFEDGTKLANVSFINCNRLSKVIIPDSVEEIRWSAFNSCKNLKDVKLPNALKSINRYAFYGTEFEKKHINEKYYVAGDNVLIFYNGPTDEVIIPYGVKYLTDDTYDKFWLDDYVAAKVVYMPETVEEISFSLAKDAYMYMGGETIDFGNEESEKIQAGFIEGTVVAPEGSYMETFCKKYDVKFRVMTEEEETIWREKTEAAASEITYQK